LCPADQALSSVTLVVGSNLEYPEPCPGCLGRQGIWTKHRRDLQRKYFDPPIMSGAAKYGSSMLPSLCCETLIEPLALMAIR